MAAKVVRINYGQNLIELRLGSRESKKTPTAAQITCIQRDCRYGCCVYQVNRQSKSLVPTDTNGRTFFFFKSCNNFPFRRNKKKTIFRFFQNFVFSFLIEKIFDRSDAICDYNIDLYAMATNHTTRTYMANVCILCEILIVFDARHRLP